MIEVFSSGGGTQSTAIAALIVQGRLPRPDIAVIADTGYEMPTTWQYMDAVTAPALAAVGVTMYRVRAADYAAPRGRHLFATSGHLMLPAYTTESGEPGKLSGFCSSAWKVEVIDRYMRLARNIPTADQRRWIGFSLDETKRVLRMQAGDDYKAGRIRFPLVNDVPMRRQEAIALVRAMGWPEPPRSRCFMCPNQSDHEWREVKRDWPDEWRRATAIDVEVRDRDPHAYLSGHFTPLADVDLSEPDDLFSATADCSGGVCFM